MEDVTTPQRRFLALGGAALIAALVVIVAETLDAPRRPLWYAPWFVVTAGPGVLVALHPLLARRGGGAAWVAAALPSAVLVLGTQALVQGIAYWQRLGRAAGWWEYLVLDTVLLLAAVVTSSVAWWRLPDQGRRRALYFVPPLIVGAMAVPSDGFIAPVVIVLQLATLAFVLGVGRSADGWLRAAGWATTTWLVGFVAVLAWFGEGMPPQLVLDTSTAVWAFAPVTVLGVLVFLVLLWRAPPVSTGSRWAPP